MPQIATDYLALMDAITEAYGKDIWQGITSSEEFHSADFATKVTQIDGISATYLKNGNVAYYTYADDVIGTAVDTSNVINSNTGLSTLSTQLQVPSQVTVDTTGKVVAESGLKTVSSGSTVTATLGKVAVGVGAVAAGVQLGAAIDSALYNANPDFWDSNGMSAINPQTWDSICSTEGGKDVFNMVFGIDKDTGETQAYMQQEALAQIAQYLVSQGVYDITTYNEVVSYGGSYTSVTPIVFYELPVCSATAESVCNNGILINENNNTSDPYPKLYAGANESGVYIAIMNNYITTYCSKSSTAIAYTASEFSEGGYGYFSNKTLYSRNYDSNTFYSNNYEYTSSSNKLWDIQLSANQNGTNQTQADLLSLFILYGNTRTITSGGIDGITPQSGATTPSGITSDMTTSEVIAQLQQLYPDLFTDAISNDVIQPDGTTQTITYVPVPIPDNINVNELTGELEPTGGTDLQQGQTTVTPTAPDNVIESLLKIITSPDPYDPTIPDTTTTTDYPDTGDGETPSVVIPTGSASALYSIYNPSQSELNSFGQWLWSSNFVDQLLKIFNDPMQAIIGLHKIFATPSVSGTGTIKVGYLDSGVSTNLVNNQYATVDCGTVDLYEYFGNSLDYIETEIYLYLPFVGIVRLNTSDIMRGQINVSYKVDVLTGACLVSVNVTRDLSGGQLYTYSGNCAVQYPLSSGSYMGIVSSLLGVAGSVVGTIASGGALLPLTLGIGASAIGGMKTQVEHSGSISGNAGAMGIKTPYLIIRRPQTAIAENFTSYMGGSQNKYVSVSSLTGYNRIKEVNLENFPDATGEEMTEIESILKQGFII